MCLCRAERKVERWKIEKTKTHKFSLFLSLALTLEAFSKSIQQHNARFYDSKSDFSDSLMIIAYNNEAILFLF